VCGIIGAIKKETPKAYFIIGIVLKLLSVVLLYTP
jgi:hypothetical protein